MQPLLELVDLDPKRGELAAGGAVASGAVQLRANPVSRTAEAGRLALRDDAAAVGDPDPVLDLAEPLQELADSLTARPGLPVGGRRAMILGRSGDSGQCGG